MLPSGRPQADLRTLGPIELFQVCARDQGDSEVWSEFLRRYASKLKYFIRGTLRQVFGGGYGQDSAATGGIQESDLFQNAIVRLVENDCAAMRRFSGTSEDDLMAYLAVICRSSVLDTLRRNNARKRRHTAVESDEAVLALADGRRHMNHLECERDILVGELVSLTQNIIRSHSGPVSNRDQLVFQLHFFDGLSYGQIAHCQGINLSKAGVEKLIKRLMGRVHTLATAVRSEETLQ